MLQQNQRIIHSGSPAIAVIVVQCDCPDWHSTASDVLISMVLQTTFVKFYLREVTIGRMFLSEFYILLHHLGFLVLVL